MRDAKHPFSKEGNHRRFKYTPEAWAIVQRQPRTSEFVFPYNAKSIGVAFTRACHVLQIPDLCFHDGRHEGTCRLFERGYQIHEVTQFTLHESWAELKRYANLRPEDVRDLPLTQKHVSAHPLARRTRRGGRVRGTSRAGGLSVPQDQQHSPATATSVLPA